MKDSAYAFAVSAVRVRETGLFTRSQTETLIAAADEDAALRLLEDYGYKGITGDPEAALSERLRTVTEFVTDVSPDTDLLSFLFIKNDFHNLKAAMKCSVSGIDPKRFFLPPAKAELDLVKKAVAEKDFQILPELMRDTATEAWNVLTAGMNGQLCEMVLDRAAIDASVAIAEASEDDFCIGLAKLRRKLTSLLIAYRCSAAGKTADFIRSALPETDEPEKQTLVKSALAGCDEVIALAGKCGVSLPETADASDIASAINALEDEYIARSAFISMGIAPVISYYLRAQREVSRIRVILSCKRCGMAEDVCRKRAGF